MSNPFDNFEELIITVKGTWDDYQMPIYKCLNGCGGLVWYKDVHIMKCPALNNPFQLIG